VTENNFIKWFWKSNR